MERFNPNEDTPQWNKGCFDDGSMARINGESIDDHPSIETVGLFSVKSWRAGWLDADMDLLTHPQEWGHITAEKGEKG